MRAWTLDFVRSGGCDRISKDGLCIILVYVCVLFSIDMQSGWKLDIYLFKDVSIWKIKAKYAN